MKTKISIKHIKDEVNQIRKKYPRLKEDAAFVYWFMRAYLVDSEEAAIKSLTGDSGDKNVDALYFDEKAKQAVIVQCKFREAERHNEKRNDVLSFANLCNFPWESKEVVDMFYSKLDPLVRERLEKLKKYVKQNKYELKLYYVTTGKCSDTIKKEVRERARQAEGPADVFVLDNHQVLNVFNDYLDGVAPAVPQLSLKIRSEGPVQNKGIVNRLDPERKIESWVFSMSAKDVGSMFSKVGVRLFARNIRGYLGSTDINNSMKETIKREPSNFWYYNNGVTIVCYNARREIEEGHDALIVEKAQIINGQQTTRTLHDTSSEKADVLVKVIKIPRAAGKEDEYDALVNAIVRATNWQNHIKASDLVSNDRMQVHLERELRKKNYQYIRKRQTKSEARRLFGSRGYTQIDKVEVAQAVAATLFDPVKVRKGKETLFEDPLYKSIFSSNAISYYLSRYWLMRKVQYAARGYPERAYAKWLVLNFAWKKLSKIISSGNGEKNFRLACEQADDALTHLNNLLIYIFRVALKFYRLNRGKGEQAKDVSAFFQLSKLDEGFEKFWNSGKNIHKSRVKEYINKFEKKLNEVEE